MFDGKQIGNGTIGVAKLSATGGPDNTKVLYGDNTWKVPPAAGVLYDAVDKNLRSQGATIGGAPGDVFNSSVIGYLNYLTPNNGSIYDVSVSGTYNSIQAYGAYVNFAFVAKSSIIGGSGNSILVRNDAAFFNGFYRSGIIGGYGNSLYADAILSAGAQPSSAWIVASKLSKIKLTGASTNNGVTLLGLYDYTVTDPQGHTVFMPQLILGRGVGGALPTSGETHALGYDSATGQVIRTASPTIPDYGTKFDPNYNTYITYPTVGNPIGGYVYNSLMFDVNGSALSYFGNYNFMFGQENRVNASNGIYATYPVGYSTLIGFDNSMYGKGFSPTNYSLIAGNTMLSSGDQRITWQNSTISGTLYYGYLINSSLIGNKDTELSLLNTLGVSSNESIGLFNNDNVDVDITGATNITHSTFIGLQSYSVIDPAINTVHFPKLKIGRGAGGALPTSGETHGLGYDSATGRVIRTALPIPFAGWPLAGNAYITADVEIRGGTKYSVEIGTALYQITNFGVNASNNVVISGGNDATLYATGTAKLESAGSNVVLYAPAYAKIYSGLGGGYGTAGDYLASDGTNAYWKTPVSDEKMKNIGGEISGAMEMVRAMQPIDFEWNRDKWQHGQDGSYFGFSAQNLQSVDSRLVSEFEKDGETYLKIRGKDQLLAIVAQAVKEIDVRLSKLE